MKKLIFFIIVFIFLASCGLLKDNSNLPDTENNQEILEENTINQENNIDIQTEKTLKNIGDISSNGTKKDIDLNSCDGIKNIAKRDLCFHMMANNVNDYEFCGKITYMTSKDLCYIDMVKNYFNPHSVCENISQKIFRDDCYKIKTTNTNTGDIVSSQKEFDTSIIYNKDEEYLRLADIGITYFEQGNMKKSLEYMKKALESATEKNSIASKYYINNLKMKIAIVLINNGEYEKGHALLKEVHGIDTP